MDGVYVEVRSFLIKYIIYLINSNNFICYLNILLKLVYMIILKKMIK